MSLMRPYQAIEQLDENERSLCGARQHGAVEAQDTLLSLRLIDIPQQF